jgi:BirA family biotin operon repressor/biotin-[acetyl-CoA-carboxylase] ligase
MPDAYLDAAAIRAATFVRHVEIHETLGSTNDRAAELARDIDIELPALIAARHQTVGRGRGSNKWLSSEGALTFSILLEPASLGISTASWPQLSLVTAVGVCDSLSGELDPQSPCLAIKWPNDVMLDGAKICGILIESPGGSAPAKDRLIIGIGINVNNSCSEQQPDTGFARTSCYDATGNARDVQRVLIATLKCMDQRLSQHAANDGRLPQAWQQLSWLSNKCVEVHTDNGRPIAGVCVGIDRDGALLIENMNGAHRVVSGSVRISGGDL